MHTNLIGRRVQFEQVPNKDISSKIGEIVSAAVETTAGGRQRMAYHVEIKGTGVIVTLTMPEGNAHNYFNLLPEVE